MLGAALVAAALAGCAPNSENLAASVMSDPLKYEFFDCKQLDQSVRMDMAQADKLHDLMAKAERDTGGAFISAMAYKTDYAKLRADLKLLREQQQRRNCITQTERGGIGAVH